MLLLIGVVVVGIIIGLALGGSLAALSEIHLRWWPLALVGLALQLVPVPSMAGQGDHWLAVGLLIASYAVLLIFVALNIRLAGFSLMAVGFALNLLVVSVNGGMPVADRALRGAYGGRYQAIRQDLLRTGGAKHHLERPDDTLIPLTDVIPVPGPTPQVVSVGDVLFLLGAVWVIAAGTRGPVGRHRARATRERRASRSPAVPGPESQAFRSD